MLHVKRILVPTDFSPVSDDALVCACQWGRSFGAEIRVFHVMQSLDPDLYPASTSLASLRSAPMTFREAAVVQLETRRRLASHQGVVVKCGVEESPTPATTILEYAEENDVDLIALGTHGRSGVRHMMLGSVAEGVVQYSNRPVLTVMGGRHSAHPLRPERILVAVDLSDHSKAAVSYAKHLAATFGAELRILHVVVPIAPPAYQDGTCIRGFTFTSPVAEKEALAAMKCVYAEAQGPSGPVDLHLEHGQAVEQILGFATAHRTDLLVLASHGATGLRHLLMGSVAERLVRRASCPVFTVKSFGKSLIRNDASPAKVVGAAS